jgi:hypothetical protein
MIELTPAGQRAGQIRRWAWEDPPARAQDALAQVSRLADGEGDPQALREIQDAATMLTRLAGSIMTPETISGQMGMQ